jgi:hypothetical protein
VRWYKHDHHQIGLNSFRWAEVYYGRHLELAAECHGAYADNPQRWIIGARRVPMPPAVVTINPAPTVEAETCSAITNEVASADFPLILTNPESISAT